jgi:hypothetical protein
LNNYIYFSKYIENIIQWTKTLEEKGYHVVNCNKGGPIDNKTNVISMPSNVGREGHTYYQYIVDHYDHLSEHLVCLQGHPFDHSPHLLEKLEDKSKLQSVDFSFLSERILSCCLSKCIHDPCVEGHLQRVHTLLGLPPRSLEENFLFGAGAQFVVSKQRILQHPRSFYQKIVDLLGKENNPVEGFVIERFHGLIFS